MPVGWWGILSNCLPLASGALHIMLQSQRSIIYIREWQAASHDKKKKKKLGLWNDYKL